MNIYLLMMMVICLLSVTHQVHAEGMRCQDHKATVPCCKMTYRSFAFYYKHFFRWYCQDPHESSMFYRYRANKFAKCCTTFKDSIEWQKLSKPDSVSTKE
ncbi:unnamed protein product [Absidia cylindrospora]